MEEGDYDKAGGKSEADDDYDKAAAFMKVKHANELNMLKLRQGKECHSG